MSGEGWLCLVGGVEFRVDVGVDRPSGAGKWKPLASILLAIGNNVASWRYGNTDMQLDRRGDKGKKRRAGLGIIQDHLHTLGLEASLCVTRSLIWVDCVASVSLGRTHKR